MLISWLIKLFRFYDFCMSLRMGFLVNEFVYVVKFIGIFLKGRKIWNINILVKKKISFMKSKNGIWDVGIKEGNVG